MFPSACLWRKRFAAEVAEPARALTFVPARILSTNAEVVVRLPNGVLIEIANASPTWIPPLVSELTRPSS